MAIPVMSGLRGHTREHLIKHIYFFCVLSALSSPPFAGRQAGNVTPTEQALQQRIIERIAASHVKAHAPSKRTFKKYLKRDLTAYFARSTGKKVKVRYEFLRNGPTQTGLSSPKYYLWVKVHASGKLAAEGAVQVAAIKQQQFIVTDYLPKGVITRSPERLYGVFPQQVNDKIRQRLHISKP